jgi:hypothetical protein
VQSPVPAFPIGLPGSPGDPLALTPPVILAPMAGITDLPWRRVVAGFGAGLVVSEMVASEEVMRDSPEMRSRAELGFTESHTAVQLVGREPYWMAEAARFVEGQGARVIDINMGCPSKWLGPATRPRPRFAADRRGGGRGKRPCHAENPARLG